jgi:hypothetical protein
MVYTEQDLEILEFIKKEEKLREYFGMALAFISNTVAIKHKDLYAKCDTGDEEALEEFDDRVMITFHNIYIKVLGNRDLDDYTFEIEDWHLIFESTLRWCCDYLNSDGMTAEEFYSAGGPKEIEDDDEDY